MEESEKPRAVKLDSIPGLVRLEKFEVKYSNLEEIRQAFIAVGIPMQPLAPEIGEVVLEDKMRGFWAKWQPSSSVNWEERW